MVVGVFLCIICIHTFSSIAIMTWCTQLWITDYIFYFHTQWINKHNNLYKTWVYNIFLAQFLTTYHSADWIWTDCCLKKNENDRRVREKNKQKHDRFRWNTKIIPHFKIIFRCFDWMTTSFWRSCYFLPTNFFFNWSKNKFKNTYS